MSRAGEWWIIAAAVWLAATGSAAGAYRQITVRDGGTIVGHVRVAGDVAPLPPQPVFKEKAYCGETMPDDRLVIDGAGNLAGAVVHLVDIHAGKAIPNTAVTLENRKCEFVPHVLSATVGQTLEIHNEDPFLHDAHAILGPRTLFNLAILKDRTVRRLLEDPGITHINCNLRHTWMHAYLFVTENPYHDVSANDGLYTLEEVPPGTYRIAVWHELLEGREREVTVAPGREVTVDFALQAVAPGGR